MPDYIASKHAVAGLTKITTLEGAKSGIRVNAVAPAAIDTQMPADIQNNITLDEPEVSGEAIKKSIPLGGLERQKKLHKSFCSLHPINLPL